jgi:hypothetical protein
MDRLIHAIRENGHARSVSRSRWTEFRRRFAPGKCSKVRRAE